MSFSAKLSQQLAKLGKNPLTSKLSYDATQLTSPIIINSRSNASSSLVVVYNVNVTSSKHSQVRNFHHLTYRTFHTKMTNKPRIILPQSTNLSNAHVKPRIENGHPKDSIVRHSYTLANSSNFQTMAGIQKLTTEPTREHIENIRHVLIRMNAKNNDNQQITLEKDSVSGIATVCIRSAAKNGISGKMMCDFLDIIDELYSWREGKGVIIYGYNGFFCSGKLI